MPALRMTSSVYRNLRHRELGLDEYPISVPCLLGGLRTSAEDEYTFWNMTQNRNIMAFPPFTARFSTTALDGHALLCGDEDGVVSVLDSRRPLRTQMENMDTRRGPHARFRAHNNAIFDAVWLQGDTQVATCAGDGSVRVFDPEMCSRTHLCRGATTTVKSLRPLPSSSNHVLVSCGRDGAIRMHDLRTPTVIDPESGPDAFHKPVFTIEKAHPQPGDGAPVVAKRRRVAPETPTGSVTSIATLPGCDHLLFSAGATDGCVKQWDIRFGRAPTAGPAKQGAACVACVTPSLEPRQGQSESRRHFGIASLDVDASGSSVLASSTDSTIYVYDAQGIERGHMRALTGHTATSFYIRASFSPCGQMVSSGSADAKGYLWDLRSTRSARSDRPFLQLDAHRTGEASIVEWCKTERFKLATCGDDATARVWRADLGMRAMRGREMDGEPCNAAVALEHDDDVECGDDGEGGAVKVGSKRMRDSDIRSFFRNSREGARASFL